MTVGAGKALSTEMTIDGDGYKVYTSIYGVHCTDPYELADDVSFATDVPSWGDSYTWGAGGNPDAFCNNKHVARDQKDATHLEWIITCSFTNKPSGKRERSSGNVATNPLNEPWKVGGSYTTGTRVTNIDKDGAPIVTTGLEPKYFEVPDGYDTVSLEGTSLFMSISTRAQAINRCNSATIWGLTARQLYLAQWTYTQEWHGSTQYFRHRMEWWIKYAGWNEVWLNEGTQEYVSTNAVGKRIVPILASNDAAGRQTRYLNSSGRILPETSIPSGVITNTSKVILESDFTTLSASIGLPNPLPGNFI